jgi:hypothetical protein
MCMYVYVLHVHTYRYSRYIHIHTYTFIYTHIHAVTWAWTHILQIHVDTHKYIDIHAHTCTYIPKQPGSGGGFEMLLRTHATPVPSPTSQIRLDGAQDGLVECHLCVEGPWAARWGCLAPPPRVQRARVRQNGSVHVSLIAG